MKSLQRYISSVNFYRQYIPRLAKKLIPQYQLLRENIKFQLTQIHKDAFFDINRKLAKAVKLSLRMPLPDQELIIMCDAREQAAGYVFFIEDHSTTNDTPYEAYAQVAFDPTRFTADQMSMTMYAEKILAMHFTFDEFGLVQWGSQKPIVVKTDKKASTGFFQAKDFSPSFGFSVAMLSNSFSF